MPRLLKCTSFLFSVKLNGCHRYLIKVLLSALTALSLSFHPFQLSLTHESYSLLFSVLSVNYSLIRHEGIHVILKL